MTVSWKLTIEGSRKYVEQGTARSRAAAGTEMIEVARLRAAVAAPCSRLVFSVDEVPVATLVTGTRNLQDQADVLDLLDEVGAAMIQAPQPIGRLSNHAAQQQFSSTPQPDLPVDQALSAPEVGPTEWRRRGQ